MPRTKYTPIAQEFYERDTLTVARELMGALIVRSQPGKPDLVARIVETEAYTGDDPACHAYAEFQRYKEGAVPKGRSAVLFGEPGHAYVYLNYGMYWLFNIVTESLGTPGAVLIRAVEAVHGIDEMRTLRGEPKHDRMLGNGPGKLALALAIGKEFNGLPIYKRGPLYVAHGELRKGEGITTTRRIGISKAQDYPWRFYVSDNPCVSVL